MPSGFTAELHDGPQSFEDFVTTAARGMGALITMRDVDFSVKPPRALEPETKYNEDKLRKALQKERYLLSQSSHSLEESAREYNRTMRKVYETSERKAEEIAWRYQEMLDEIERTEWPEILLSFKDFMVKQLKESLMFDVSITKEPVEISAKEYLDQELARTQRDIEYHQEQIRKEIERTRERNEWLSALWDVLDQKKARWTKTNAGH